MAGRVRRRRIGAIARLVVWILVLAGSGVLCCQAVAAANPLATGEELSQHADALAKEGQDQQAAQLYLAAHKQFQDVILKYFEAALRESLGGPSGKDDEETLMHAGSVAGDLRNVNLSKLWIVLDPEDRAYRQGLEAERASLVQRFDQFRRADSAGPLEDFLLRLYPEDESGERQMEAVRDGRMPPSKRWARLQYPLSP